MEPPTLWFTMTPTGWRSPLPDSMTPALRQACPSTSIRGDLSCQISLHFATELPCSNLQRVEASFRSKPTVVNHPHILWYHGWIKLRVICWLQIRPDARFFGLLLLRNLWTTSGMASIQPQPNTHYFQAQQRLVCKTIKQLQHFSPVP